MPSIGKSMLAGRAGVRAGVRAGERPDGGVGGGVGGGTGEGEESGAVMNRFQSEQNGYPRIVPRRLSPLLGNLAAADLSFDPGADIRVDIFPVLKRSFQHFAAYARQQAAGHLVDQLGTLIIVKHVADQDSGL